MAITHAASIKFNVIAPNATDVKVSVNGQQVALTASNPNVPYFTGSAEVGASKTYKVLQFIHKALLLLIITTSML